MTVERDGIELVLAAKARHGESPVWDPRNNTLLWVDAYKCEIHRFNPADGGDVATPVDAVVGTVALRAKRGLVAAMRAEIRSDDRDPPDWNLLARAEFRGNEERFNDGKPDPVGRLWVGSMTYDWSRPGPGGLYCLETDGTLKRVLNGITCSNGIAWNAAGTVMYHIDSSRWSVDAYDFDAAAGTLGPRRVAVAFEKHDGVPDGMTIDEADNLWVALYAPTADCGGIACCDPRSGKQLQLIRMPVPYVTSCAFGGADLNELFITSSSNRLLPQHRAQFPTAGSIFRIRPNARGGPIQFFKG